MTRQTDIREYQKTVVVRYNERRAPRIHVATYKESVTVWFPGADGATWLTAGDARALAKALTAAARRREVIDRAEAKRLREWKRGR